MVFTFEFWAQLSFLWLLYWIFIQFIFILVPIAHWVCVWGTDVMLNIYVPSWEIKCIICHDTNDTMTHVHCLQVGNVSPESLGYLNRVRQRNSLGPSRDGNNFAVVHCTGYIKNWPPQGLQMDRNPEDEMHASSSCCLVAIGRLQV